MSGFAFLLKTRLYPPCRRRGPPRGKWSHEVLGLALSAFPDHPFFQELHGESKREHASLWSLAQDKGRWDRVSSWAAE
eukprot:13353599-Alexandrium_andersonii.AAC.1